MFFEALRVVGSLKEVAYLGLVEVAATSQFMC